jgi:hypothetical protein
VTDVADEAWTLPVYDIDRSGLQAGEWRQPLAVPHAQVADSDSDDLRRSVWTQRRVQRRELAHHLLSTEARVHQATHIPALVQRLLATVAVPEVSRTDICQERTLTRYRRGGVRNRVGTQGDGRQDGQANYPHPSRATVSPP